MKLMNHSQRFMNVCRRIIMAVALSLVLVAPQSFAAQESGKVGVVDSGKIFQQLPEAKQAESTLQAAAGPLQKEIAMKNQELQKAIAERKGTQRQESGFTKIPAGTKCRF